MSYKEGILEVAKNLPKKNGNFLITGVTGLIGSCMADVLIEANKNGAHFVIYGMSRSEDRIKERFENNVIPVVQDVVTLMILKISMII